MSRSGCTDLDQIAAELGLTPAQLDAHIREAIDAGFLRIVDAGDDLIAFEGLLPDEGEEA